MSIGEPLLSDSSYSVHELPSEQDHKVGESPVALKARIELVEAETAHSQSTDSSSHHFRVEQIAHNDNLVKFYTGFSSYSLFLLFF